MKVSELREYLDNLPADIDPEIVTGEVWLPEPLIDLHSMDNYLFCEFDNAPEEGEGEEEGRGFVDHEIQLIRDRIERIFLEKTALKNKQDAILALILFAHERLPSEVVELLSGADESPDQEV